MDPSSRTRAWLPPVLILRDPWHRLRLPKRDKYGIYLSAIAIFFGSRTNNARLFIRLLNKYFVLNIYRLTSNLCVIQIDLQRVFKTSALSTHKCFKSRIED